MRNKRFIGHDHLILFKHSKFIVIFFLGLFKPKSRKEHNIKCPSFIGYLMSKEPRGSNPFFSLPLKLVDLEGIRTFISKLIIIELCPQNTGPYILERQFTFGA